MCTDFIGKYYFLGLEKLNDDVIEEAYQEVLQKIDFMAIYAGVNNWELSTLEFSEGNKAKVKLIGENEIIDGTYRLEGNTIHVVDIEGTEILTLSVNNDTLTLENEAGLLVYGNTPPKIEEAVNIDREFVGKYYMISIEKARSSDDFSIVMDMMESMCVHNGKNIYELNTLEFFDGNRIKANFMGSDEVEGRYVIKGNSIYAFEDDGYPIALLDVQGDTLTMVNVYGKITFGATPPVF